MTKTVRLYGCGGAGVNIANHYASINQTSTTMAKISPAAIDTSMSNLKGTEISESMTYLIEGLDGSGKVRKENYEEVTKNVRQMINEIEPTEVNLVVFSASGGSGSVIGPLITKALIDQGAVVIPIVIGSYDSTICAENTTNTLKSLEGVSAATDSPVIMSYHLNDSNKRRSEVDATIYSVVGTLALLTSGEVAEVDTQDIRHWAYYNKIAGKPQLSTLHVVLDSDRLEQYNTPVAAASLYPDPDAPHTTVGADYHVIGYTDLSTVDNADEVHFVVSQQYLTEIYSDISDITKKMVDTRDARVDRDSIIDKKKDKPDENGLVL